MISGKVALGGISLEFGNEQKRFDELTGRVKELEAECEEALSREREVIQELAEIYLPDLSPGAVAQGLEALQTRLQDALRDQERHRQRLVEELEASTRRVEDHQKVVAKREEEEERLARETEECRKRAEGILGGGSRHAELSGLHRTVMERRELLKSRRARLLAVANIERHRYESHAPFGYLLSRGYGQPEYRAGWLTRRMDAWLAGRIDFQAMSVRYRILRTGPHVVQAEIRRLNAEAEEYEKEIDRLEAVAGAESGLASSLKEGAQAQGELLSAREALAEAASARDALAGELRRTTAFGGRPYEDAVASHRDFLESRTLVELLELAHSTPDPRDDALVAKLGKIRTRIEGIREELVTQRRELERVARRTGSLAELIREATSRFSSRRSYFPEDFHLTETLRTIREEISSPAEVIQVMESAHVTEPILVTYEDGALEGWFAEMSSEFDLELESTTVHTHTEVEAETMESEIVVTDGKGRVIHRRITRRGGE